MATTEDFYTGGSGDTTFGFTFPILQNSDLKVELDGVIKTENTSGTNNDYSISNTNVVFNSAPASGVDIHFYRVTDVDTVAPVFVSGSAIRAQDLNSIADKTFYSNQEQHQKVKTADIRDKAVTSAKILDGTIVNADINASAAIDGSKLQISSGSVSGSMSSANFTKLAGIETGATADQTAAEIRTLVGNATDSNVFTDADHTKLDGIETAATADQTDAEIRTAVESATDSNVFTDADHTKLNGIATGAEVNVNADWNASSGDAQILNKPTLVTGLNALSDVNTSGVADGKILKYDASASEFIIADDGGSGSGGATAFTGLSDTPANFGSAAGKTLKVNSAGDAVEFVTVTTPAGNFAGLTDTPANFTGGAGKVVKVNSNADGLEFTATGIVSADSDPELSSGLDVKTYEINTSETNGNVKLSPNGTGAIEIRGAGGNDGTLQLNCSANSHGVKIKSPAHSNNATYTLTLPTAISAGKPLITDVNGNLSWGSNFLTNTTSWTTSHNIGAFGGITLGAYDTIEFDSDDSNIYHINFTGPTTLTKNSEFTLPEDGTNGQYLKTNGSGVLSFADVSSTYNISINTLSSSSGSGGGSATFNGSATRFTLSNAGTNAQAHIVSVNGVIQKPNSGTSPSEGFAIDGNDIIFAAAPASGSDFFILTLGNAVSIGTPSDDTVTSAKIVDGSIVNADINTSAAIAGSKLADDSITETKLDIHAAPSGTDKVLGYTANGMEWVVAEAGATGGGTDKIFYENGQTVTTNYTITNNTNAMSAGPVTINSGIAVTIGTGENWTIV